MPEEDIIDFVCLANSRKMGHRCIAGLRLDEGGWVRPISSRPHGELQHEDCCYEDGELPETLEVVSFVAAEYEPPAHQPENRLVDDEFFWEKLRNAGADDLTLVESWVESWVESGPLFGCQNNKVPFEEGLLPPNSLCLVEPRDLSFAVRFNHQARKLQSRARFDLQGARYDLPITDIGLEKELVQLGQGTHWPEELDIAESHRTLFVVSLGEPFNGHCYKLIAGMIVLGGPGATRETEEGLEQPDAGKDEKTQPAGGTDAAGTRGLSTNQIVLLDAIGQGLTYEQVLARNPDSTYLDIFAAAKAAADLARATAPQPPRSKEVREEYPRAHSPWTPEEEQRLLQLRRTGAHTNDDLAEALGRTPGAIYSRLEKLGYSMPFSHTPVATKNGGRIPSNLHLKRRIDEALQSVQGNGTQECNSLIAEAVSRALKENGFAAARSLRWCCLATGEHCYADVVGFLGNDLAVAFEIDYWNRKRPIRRLGLLVDMSIAAYWIRWGPSHNLPSVVGLNVPESIHLIECPTDCA